jgi:bacillithiol biosynthesis cysteine-adding enzyme BshC
MSDSKLLSEYINNSERVRDLYPKNFRDENSWRKVMAEVSSRGHDYSGLAQILRRQNSALGSGQAAMENIDKLAGSRKAFAVVTGQQVGIFTGPLYTIYKAMTAVKLARHLHEKYGHEFVPVFWMESNDHDIEEANHINLLDSDDELVKVEYLPTYYTSGCSMKDVPIDDGFCDIVLDLETRFPNTEFKRDIFEIIRGSYLVSQSLSHGFGRMMAQLLGKYGLVLLDPSDPDIKGLMSPIFEREIKSPLESMKIVNSAGEKLRTRGHESQIEKSWDSTGLFVEESGVRRKLFFRDGRFRMDGSDESFADGEQLVSILRTQPWRFSPNVALRPVTQDYMMPTVAYVAGPGETSYFAQLGDLYAFLDVNMPIIYPRASLTIIESKVERIMEKNGLEMRDLSEHHNDLFSRLSKRMAAGKLERLLKSSRSEIDDVLKRLASDLTGFDPGLKNIAESTKRKVDHQINILEEKAYKAQRSRDEILRSQVKRACMNIYPGGKPQDRVFNIVQYLVLYGLRFVDDVLSAIDMDSAKGGNTDDWGAQT